MKAYRTSTAEWLWNILTFKKESENCIGCVNKEKSGIEINNGTILWVCHIYASHIVETNPGCKHYKSLPYGPHDPMLDKSTTKAEPSIEKKADAFDAMRELLVGEFERDTNLWYTTDFWIQRMKGLLENFKEERELNNDLIVENLRLQKALKQSNNTGD